jgi:hypothetical protein
VIGPARQIAVYAFGEPVDMRKSFNMPSTLVVGLGRDVLNVSVRRWATAGRLHQHAGQSSRPVPVIPVACRDGARSPQ